MKSPTPGFLTAALCGAALLFSHPVLAQTETVPADGGSRDYPLKFETIPAKDVMAFPGGSGLFGMLQLQKPHKLMKEPKAVSAHPIYGECRPFLFRLDESKGTGRGYDRLIVDMNQDGDLTDDAVARTVSLPGEERASSSDMEQALFGPILAPADKAIAGERPIFYAQVFIYNRNLIENGSSDQRLFLGQIRFKAGWYLATTVEANGAKRKVGVFDGNSNLRLGDSWQPQTYRMRGEGENWMFQAGDSFLVSAEGAGKFVTDQFASQACPFGHLLYLGSTPYRVSLVSDDTALRIEPWKDALAEVELQPRGKEVCGLTLARERPNGNWELIKPGVADGRIKVPPGNYRLYECTLLGVGEQERDSIKLSGYERSPKKPSRFEAGHLNTLLCGGPLEVKVATRRLSRGDNVDGDTLGISTTVIGAEGEVYSTFGKGRQFNTRPPRPAFRILDADGNRLAGGNLEYG